MYNTCSNEALGEGVLSYGFYLPLNQIRVQLIMLQWVESWQSTEVLAAVHLGRGAACTWKNDEEVHYDYTQVIPSPCGWNFETHAQRIQVGHRDIRSRDYLFQGWFSPKRENVVNVKVSRSKNASQDVRRYSYGCVHTMHAEQFRKLIEFWRKIIVIFLSTTKFENSNNWLTWKKRRNDDVVLTTRRWRWWCWHV
jgi:hypothetical protein